MNLHKTFCIPHGGGGPGVGPIGVKAHLAPFLPGHAVVTGVNPAAGKDQGQGAVSAAPWGSASILPISWTYIAMMGGEGLTRATRWRSSTPTTSPGASIRISRCSTRAPAASWRMSASSTSRWLKERTGLSVEDVAKRLVDYGFHAPTMSLPVPDTLMIEPTESEGKRELDRFCDAMIEIRKEIAEVEEGKADRLDNPLKNAPHTHRLLLGDWKHPYSKEQAFFPLEGLSERQVLAAGGARRQRLRRPEPRLHLPAHGELHGGGGVGATLTPAAITHTLMPGLVPGILFRGHQKGCPGHAGAR